jgi:CheY-like chemotaxis protein
MKILVVDDEKDIESLFKQKFKKELFENSIDFHFAFSSEEALEYLENNSSDIVMILSDINMPGMNGLELLRVLKEKFSDKTVFMITAYDDDDKHRKAIEYGADKYLTKPIEFSKLKEEIFRIK